MNVQLIILAHEGYLKMGLVRNRYRVSSNLKSSNVNVCELFDELSQENFDEKNSNSNGW